MVGALRRHATCSSGALKKRIPILDWLPKYKQDYLLADFVAGLTVGLTAIPQGIAYAVVAGLEPQYGLYAGFMGCFVYMFFGSCKDVTIGENTKARARVVQGLLSQRANARLSFISWPHKHTDWGSNRTHGYYGAHGAAIRQH